MNTAGFECIIFANKELTEQSLLAFFKDVGEVPKITLRPRNATSAYAFFETKKAYATALNLGTTGHARDNGILAVKKNWKFAPYHARMISAQEIPHGETESKHDVPVSWSSDDIEVGGVFTSPVDHIDE
jgi:hypothetical protein